MENAWKQQGFCWKETADELLVLARRFETASSEAALQMRPRDAERFAQQMKRLMRKLEAAANLPQASEKERIVDALAETAGEAWQLNRIAARTAARMNFVSAQPFVNGYRWFQRQAEEMLSQVGIQAIDFSGEPYSPGLPVNVLNAHECEGDVLRIAQMVEPVIMAQGSVWRMGSAMLEENDG